MNEKKLNGILADEMGLGKTIQTISLLAHLAVENCNWGPHLIVVPTSVMLNWEMEFKKWCPGFKILTYYGSQKERKLKRTGWSKANSFHVCITSYKLVIQDHQSFRRKRWKYLILDEAQNIKNFKSQRWQLLLNFNAQRRLLLTGTPLQNNLMELWSLMHFLMPNVFQSHREFREWFSNPVTGMVEGSSEYNENIIRRLHKVLRPFILRRLKSEVEKQLPKKYEHLVMCRLSKRQRFLYEEFMSRTRTKDTLSSDNLLSVINVLMQLRKVCNHPNLFEPRPVTSPFQLNGITYVIPSIVWNIVDEILEKKPSYPIFRMIEDDLIFSKEEAWRIGTLAPGYSCEQSGYSDDGFLKISSKEHGITLRDKSRVKMFKSQDSSPPSKKRRIDFSEIVERHRPPPLPRLHSPIPFFITTVDPNSSGLFDDPDFVDYVAKRSTGGKKNNLLFNGGIDAFKPKPKVDNGRKHIIEVKVEPTSPKDESSHNSNDIIDNIKKEINDVEMPEENDDELEVLSDRETSDTEDSDQEIVESYKKRKIVVTEKKSILEGILALGYNPVEFEMSQIQERIVSDKKSVLEKLQSLNQFRCEINPVYGQSVLEKLSILPPYQDGRRLRFTNKKSRYFPFNMDRNECFKLGYSEIAQVVRAKLSHQVKLLPNHPDMQRDHTKCLSEMILTLEERFEALKSIICRFVIYVPAVTAPLTQCKIFRPAASRYCQDLHNENEMRNNLRKPSEILHPIISRMSTQFPDPRLIEYDCGKLQTLQKLLRQLKEGTHRVLIFTQMTRMLDVLELFLTYHGHIYLRLDGATRIDQRQILMERFNTDKRIFCFILSTRSGGIGVNLTGADTVIFYDSDWNPTMDAQAQDRCHRIGQTRDVHIYRLVSEKTVEENILKKSNQKRMLGEIAIEGGSFNTAYFTKNTIHDLFEVDQQENDPRKRLAELTTGNLGFQDRLEVGQMIISVNTPSLSGPTEDGDEKGAMQMLESALLTAEEETDVKAAKTLRAEAAAELAEFDETISLDELDVNTPVEPVEEAPRSEIEEIFDQLNPVELYAVRLMKNCLEDWTSETYANAEKDMEKQKQEWEDAQQRHLQDLEKEEEEEDTDDEEILAYFAIDPKNHVKRKGPNKKKEINKISVTNPPKRGRGRPTVKKVVTTNNNYHIDTSKTNGFGGISKNNRGRPGKNRRRKIASQVIKKSRTALQKKIINSNANANNTIIKTEVKDAVTVQLRRTTRIRKPI